MQVSSPTEYNIQQQADFCKINILILTLNVAPWSLLAS